jgi:hypothetical protein
MARGFALLALALLALPPLVGALGDDAASPVAGRSIGPGGKETCGGVAPAVIQCVTGTHTPVADVPLHAGLYLYPFVGMAHGILRDFPGDGCSCTVESRIVWLPFGIADALTALLGQPVGQRIYRCNLQRGYIYDCDDPEGQFPPFGVFVAQHECFTYEYRTRIPGGEGRWGCYIQHD